MPVRGKRFYKLHNFLPIEPPKTVKTRGRPKTKRMREESEGRARNGGTKLSKKGRPITCSRCHQQEHNKAGCKKTSESEGNDGETHNGHRSSSQGSNKGASSRGANEGAGSQALVIANKLPIRVSTARSKSKQPHGIGLMYNENTGSMSYSTGKQILCLTEGSNPASSDLNTRFPIPNETQLRRDKAEKTSSSRKISFKGDGGPVPRANLPFKPPGLQFRGRTCVTGNQLQAERDKMINKISLKSMTQDGTQHSTS